jgi:membrane-bound lytic murein transglycosylase C
MLNNVYLAIDNPTSRRYAVITAYNGGAGSTAGLPAIKSRRPIINNSMAPGRLPDADHPPSVGGIAPLSV